MPFTIRHAALADIVALQELFVRSSLSNEGDRELLLAHPESTTLAEDGVREQRTRVVVDPDGAVVGFASYRIVDSVVELEDLFVDPPCMRQGIGTSLVRDMALVGELGFATMEVTANPHAMDFYEHAGFVPDRMVETVYYPAPRMRRSTYYAPEMPLELIPLCNVDITLREAIFVGNGPRGLRLVIEVEAATVTGDRLRGKAKGSASADWVTVVDNVGTVDVRSTLETDDGALILCQYTGRIDFTNGPGAAPIYVAPTFETGDERYTWLNFVQAAGVGTMDATATSVHYEWYELRSV